MVSLAVLFIFLMGTFVSVLMLVFLAETMRTSLLFVALRNIPLFLAENNYFQRFAGRLFSSETYAYLEWD